MPIERSDLSSGLASKFESVVDILANSLKEKRKELLTAIGERPYKGFPISLKERQARYKEIRNNPSALMEVFKGNAKFKPDGRVLIPKELIKTIQQMEKSIKTGKDIEEIK